MRHPPDVLLRQPRVSPVAIQGSSPLGLWCRLCKPRKRWHVGSPVRMRRVGLPNGGGVFRVVIGVGSLNAMSGTAPRSYFPDAKCVEVLYLKIPSLPVPMCFKKIILPIEFR